MFSSDDDFGPIEHDFKCYRCNTTVLGRGRYRALHEYWCQACLEKERLEAVNNKPELMLWHEVSRQKHDDVVAENLGYDPSHLKWCRCGSCRPPMSKEQYDALKGGA